ncbi:MAG: RNA polymerase sigma factor [Gemmatimonadota bacterium]|nr:MAG: RNA polymerase sigma factor [Gemmatimonadota bacterium]
MARAFEELIGTHLDDLYSAALCFTLDEGRAEELVQEASIRAFHEYPYRQHDADFRLLMLGALVSTFLQRQRRQGRDPLAPHGGLYDETVRSTEWTPIEPFPEVGSPGYRVLLDWFSRVWAQLDDGDRLVLWLADVERLRHRRVAEMTGLDLEEVRARHYRARRSLSRSAERELGRRASGGAKV